jgi:arabinogalactan endo-1,4-beta-galactosidase
MGGSSKGGAPSAGADAGGMPASGGGDTGGSEAGGVGGEARGGAVSTTGGEDTGAAGEASAGAPAAGAGGGGATGTEGGAAGAGGAGGEPSVPRPDFMLGADISSVQEAVDQGVTFVDTDGEEKTMLELLAAHGFNFIRLRTFVEPMNLYGYANPNGNTAYVRDEPYCDSDHTAEFGKQVKDAGMKLLVDLHYSDNWADPGKQVIPESWRDAASIDDLGERVKAYTSDVIQKLVDAGAAPDIVQIGNEIAPGFLIHIPSATPNADQWGNMNMLTNSVNGAVNNWVNLGSLLKKGIEGVHAVDPNIKIMMHLANTQNAGGVLDWVTRARAQGVSFDILGLSCYTQWHGQPSVWENTFKTLARNVPDLKFVIAEYGPEARRANDIMRALPDERGLGTFVWEPTQSGTWGPSLFAASSKKYTALETAFGVYDQIRADYGMP